MRSTGQPAARKAPTMLPAEAPATAPKVTPMSRNAARAPTYADRRTPPPPMIRLILLPFAAVVMLISGLVAFEAGPCSHDHRRNDASTQELRVKLYRPR